MNWFFDLGSHLFESVGIFADIVGNSHDWNVVCVEAAYTDDNKLTIDEILATHDICPFSIFFLLAYCCLNIFWHFKF